MRETRGHGGEWRTRGAGSVRVKRMAGRLGKLLDGGGDRLDSQPQRSHLLIDSSSVPSQWLSVSCKKVIRCFFKWSATSIPSPR